MELKAGDRETRRNRTSSFAVRLKLAQHPALKIEPRACKLPSMSVDVPLSFPEMETVKHSSATCSNAGGCGNPEIQLGYPLSKMVGKGQGTQTANLRVDQSRSWTASERFPRELGSTVLPSSSPCLPQTGSIASRPPPARTRSVTSVPSMTVWKLDDISRSQAEPLNAACEACRTMCACSHGTCLGTLRLVMAMTRLR